MYIFENYIGIKFPQNIIPYSCREMANGRKKPPALLTPWQEKLNNFIFMFSQAAKNTIYETRGAV